MHELTGTVGGVVERENIIDGTRIKEGDVLLGLASSGLHTNGYSLARKIFFEDNNYSCDDKIEELGTTLGNALLATHREYATPVSKNAIRLLILNSLIYMGKVIYIYF